MLFGVVSLLIGKRGFYVDALNSFFIMTYF